MPLYPSLVLAALTLDAVGMCARVVGRHPVSGRIAAHHRCPGQCHVFSCQETVSLQARAAQEQQRSVIVWLDHASLLQRSHALRLSLRCAALQEL